MNRATLLLMFLLGAWSAGTVFMWQTAIQSFTVAERVASEPTEELQGVVDGISEGELRAVVRYQASEVNRFIFRGWGWVQIGLAVAALVLAWLAQVGRVAQVGIAVMLVIVVGLAVYVVPETTRLGRMMDFAPDSALADVRAAFWFLHHSYTAADMLKLIMGLSVIGILLRRRRGSSSGAS